MVAALVVAVAVVEAAAVVVSAAAVADLPAPEREGRAGDGTRAPVEALELRRRVSMLIRSDVRCVGRTHDARVETGEYACRALENCTKPREAEADPSPGNLLSAKQPNF